jgi:hypothetical protein
MLSEYIESVQQCACDSRAHQMIDLTTIIQKGIQSHSSAGKLLRLKETGSVVDKLHSDLSSPK